MEQSPSWKATRSSGCQEIPHILWNMKVHYHIQKSWSLIPILSHMNPIQSTPSNCTSLRLILILQTYLHLSLPNGIFSSGFPTKSQHLPPFSSHPAHLTPPGNMWWGVQKMKLLIMKFSPVSYYPTFTKMLLVQSYSWRHTPRHRRVWQYQHTSHTESGLQYPESLEPKAFCILAFSGFWVP